MPSVGNTGFNNSKASVAGKIAITGADNLFVDPGWYGSIVVEADGTNESLADLQDRCGPGAFPPRVRGAHAAVSQGQVENRKVFRILRERRYVNAPQCDSLSVLLTWVMLVDRERYGSSVLV
jgi:hypothetical protein